jgi:hypothetical protein
MIYIPNPIDTARIQLSEDVMELIEHIAKNNHECWAKQRISEGWKFGEKRNDKVKEHPDLIPYEELPESEKDYDRKTAIEIFKMAIFLGYQIIKP